MAGTAASIDQSRSRVPEVVKSAVRVLEILDFFDRSQRAASVGQVSAGLGFPQSSTSALLRSLVKVGYLKYDAGDRTFVPTARVTMLGGWRSGSFFSDGPILAIARALAERTGYAVAVARRNSRQVQWLHTIGSSTMDAEMIHDRPAHLLRSAVGLCLLAQTDERDIRGIVHRLNSETDDLTAIMRHADVFKQVETVRRDGYCAQADDGLGAISMTVPVALCDEPIAIVIFPPLGQEHMPLHAIVSVMRETMAEHARQPEAGVVVPLPSYPAFRAQLVTQDMLVAQAAKH